MKNILIGVGYTMIAITFAIAAIFFGQFAGHKLYDLSVGKTTMEQITRGPELVVVEINGTCEENGFIEIIRGGKKLYIKHTPDYISACKNTGNNKSTIAINVGQ